MRIGRFVAVSVIVLAIAGQARAGTIISNIPPTDPKPIYNTNGQVNTGLGSNYAVEFSAIANETVTSATLILSIQAGTTPTLGIYNSSSGAIGSLVGSFTPVGLTLGTAKTETFTGSAALTSGKSYFLVLDGNNLFNWSATFTAANLSGLVPTGSGATYIAAGSSGSYAAGNTKPSFELDTAVAVVPEPATFTLLGIGIAGMAGYGWRRRKSAMI